MVDANEMIEDSEAIVGAYLFFARLLNEEMNRDFREVLLEPAVLEVLAKADEKAAEYLERDWSDCDFEKAAADFCDLFILPDRSTHPRAAAWLGESDPVSPDGIHAVVDSFLREKGITLPGQFADLPYDHASVLFVVAAALRKNRDPQASEFEQATLGSWIGSFGSALQSCSNPLYSALGSLIATVSSSDSRHQ